VNLQKLEAEFAASHPNVAYHPNSIRVTRGGLWIGDPCYAKTSELTVDARNGLWNARFLRDGTFVLEHESRVPLDECSTTHYKASVDSGRLFVIDEELYPSEESGDPRKEAFFASVCEVEGPGGRAEGGFVIGTGGDGTFTVEVWDHDGKAVCVVLLGTLGAAADDDDDDDEYEEDEVV